MLFLNIVDLIMEFTRNIITASRSCDASTNAVQKGKHELHWRTVLGMSKGVEDSYRPPALCDAVSGVVAHSS
jgi:hypothetical protein